MTHYNDMIWWQWQQDTTMTMTCYDDNDTLQWQWHATVTMTMSHYDDNDTLKWQWHIIMTITHYNDTLWWQWHTTMTTTHYYDNHTLQWHTKMTITMRHHNNNNTLWWQWHTTMTMTMTHTDKLATVQCWVWLVELNMWKLCCLYIYSCTHCINASTLTVILFDCCKHFCQSMSVNSW